MNSVYVGLAAFAYVGVIVCVLRLMHNCPVDGDEEV